MTVGLCWLRLKPKGLGREVLFHNGGTGGYRSFLALDTKRGRAVVVLSNSAHGVDEVGFKLLKELD